MKKHIVLLVSLVFAFGIMGAGYAAWSQELTINQTIETGLLAFSFDADGEILPNENSEAFFDAENALMFDGSSAVAAGDALDVTIVNAYPGATATVNATIANASTVPARLAFSTDFLPEDVRIIGITVNDEVLEVDAMVDGEKSSASPLLLPEEEVAVAYTLLVVDPDDADNEGGLAPEYDTTDSSSWADAITGEFAQESSFDGSILLTFVQDTYNAE